MEAIADADLAGKRVLLRSDLNLSLQQGTPHPDLRFERYMETVARLAEMGARTVIVAHQGRPGQDDFVSLQDHAALAGDHLDRDVAFVPAFFGDALPAALDGMTDGDIAMLENIRFLSEELQSLGPERHGHDVFVDRFADLFDVYVNDAFSAAHRSHASIVGFPPRLPSYAGRVMTQELEGCRRARDELEDPVLVLGGEKPADIVDVLDRMIDRADRVLLGGVPGELAVHVQGGDLGDKWDWLRERSLTVGVDRLEELLAQYPDTFELPSDVRTDAGNHAVDAVPDGERPWDIGTETAQRYRRIIADAASVVMKGPMGAFERGFDGGTKTVLNAVAACDGYTVLGGGHTSSLVRLFGHDLDEFSHVSIAGGAFVRFMSGETLPGVRALERFA